MNKTYAFSDLHGEYELWKKIIEYVNPEDTLYCLGDCIDRGQHGIQIVEELKHRPNTFYIKGNHEDMAAAAIPDCIEGHFTSDLQLWYMNGGKITWKELRHMQEERQLFFSKYFAHLSLREVYINQSGQHILLDHCGFTPDQNINFWEPLWDRRHFHQKWHCKRNTPKEEEPIREKTIVVHGHTPVQCLKFEFGYYDNDKVIWTPLNKEELKEKPEIIKYCDGHKIDIDLGSVNSKRTALLDLDTLEPIYFDEDVKNESDESTISSK